MDPSGTTDRQIGPSHAESATEDSSLSEDRLLGGRIVLRQPRDGYRAAIDPVLLAAAVDVRRGGLVLDAGLGTGAAALCLLARRPDLRVIGLEADPGICALAAANAAANGVSDRLAVRHCTVSDAQSVLATEAITVDGVMTNPPYLAADSADASPNAGRRRANLESTPLSAWIAACAAPLRTKSPLTLVHRADRVDDAIVALKRAGFGEVAILPLWPKPGAAARRVLLRARKGIAGAARLLPGLVLHGPAGGYTPEAEAILRDAAPVDWKVSTSPADTPH